MSSSQIGIFALSTFRFEEIVNGSKSVVDSMRFDGLNFIIAKVVHNEGTTIHVEEEVGLQNEITGRAKTFK
jgi:hypothetical protein